MDEDLEREKGLPANAVKLAKLFAAHSGIIIVTPEYNASFTPLLKNTLDWVSRVSSDKEKPVTPYRDKLAAIASSSPGAMGGISSLNHLRDVLVRLGMQVISEQLSVGNAAKAFDHHDRLTVDRQQQILAKACASLVRKTQLLG
jgi:NAD(P)H-dependent FMN reductase